MRAEIEELLYREAWLLDEGRFGEWLELLAPELKYWAPSRAELDRATERAEEGERIALFDETKATLTLRVERLGTGLAWVDNPTTRTRRFVSNVLVATASDGVLGVRSNLLVFKSRSYVDQAFLVGCREDLWRAEGASWLLKERKIILDHTTLENLFLLL